MGEDPFSLGINGKAPGDDILQKGLEPRTYSPYPTYLR